MQLRYDAGEIITAAVVRGGITYGAMTAGGAASGYIGAAIGTAICPGIGTVIGFAVGVGVTAGISYVATKWDFGGNTLEGYLNDGINSTFGW